MIFRELQKHFGEIYLGGEKTIQTDMFFVVANITTTCQMDASKFEGMIYNMLSEEPFTHQILENPDGNEESTISDYLSQNFSITIGETWTCFTYESNRIPKITKNISLILSLEQNFEYTKKVRQISHEKKTQLGKSCVTMNDLMSKFDESNELSDVICDECSKVSVTEQKSNF